MPALFTRTLTTIGDRVRAALPGAARHDWKIGIQAYRSYGTERQLQFACRVLRDPELSEASIHDSFWDNLKSSFHRFESDEISGARLSVTYQGQTIHRVTDSEGYASGELRLLDHVGPGWQQLQMGISELPFGTAVQEHVTAECLVPSRQARFGIISDIDDTVLHSQVTSRLRMLFWTLTHNSYSRLPLPGVGRLYRELAEVDRVRDVNPVFYVSSSPWNLYPMLIQFMHAVDLPRGPVLLRDLNIHRGWGFGEGNHDHKLQKIADILNTYPQLPFLLLGDSGQHDAELYSRAIVRFPGRILCAYIRDVGWSDDGMLQQAQQVASAAGSEMLLVSDSQQIEQHARQRGWIQSPESLPSALSAGSRSESAVQAAGS